MSVCPAIEKPVPMRCDELGLGATVKLTEPVPNRSRRR